MVVSEGVNLRQRLPSRSQAAQDSHAPRRLPAVLRVVGPSKDHLAFLLLASDSVLLAWHDSGPVFSVNVGGRLRC
jgi:hypothetical protein